MHRLHVLLPFQEPWRLPAADAGGGSARALLHRGARPTCEPLALPGAVAGAWNRGGGRGWNDRGIRGWKRVMRRRGRRGGRKVRARRKGGCWRQAGDGEGAANATERITGDGDGTNELRCQRAWGYYGNDGATAPPQAAVGAAHGGGGDIVGGWRRGGSESMRGVVAPVAMVVKADPLREGGPTENPGGGGVGSGPRAFWGLMDLIQLIRLEPDSQGVAILTNR